MKRIHWILIILLCWAFTAYLLIPRLWEWHYRHHEFDGGPRITRTGDGHPGDPVNIAIEGGEEELIRALTAAKWYPADPVTLASSARIVKDSVFPKPDDTAPVSPLFLFGRRQDLAFELPVGDSPRQRHHVRFWKWDQQRHGRPVWFGAVTFDERVGLSHTTGQVTHHIGSDVDAERNLLMSGLQNAGGAKREFYINGFHPQTEGRNGGGDLWRTDGRLGAAILIHQP